MSGSEKGSQSDIVILAAMGSEVEPLQRYIPDVPVIGTGVGKVAAASLTMKVILQQQPRAIVFVGVAGGLADDLEQLSVIVATDAGQWDVDITPVNGGEPGTLNDGRRFIALDATGSKLALEAAQAQGFHARMGRVVTGDAFLASQEKADWLKQNFAADAVEMEGAAALQVAHDHGIPMVLIRVISDGAGDEAALTYGDFLPRAAERAALVTEHFLPRWLETLSPRPAESSLAETSPAETRR
jgi:5'-methylthioadenosine/S-adenosylhomocysteine nucleosidase